MHFEYLKFIHKPSTCYSESGRAMVFRTCLKSEGALRNGFDTVDEGKLLLDGGAGMIGKDRDILSDIVSGFDDPCDESDGRHGLYVQNKALAYPQQEFQKSRLKFQCTI